MIQVLFDIDGTLLDVFGAHTDSYVKTLKDKFGVDIDRDLIESIYGRPESDCYRVPLKSFGITIGDKKIKELMDYRAGIFLDFVKQGIKEFVFDGVFETLDYLQSKNVKMAFISGNSRQVGEALLKYSGLRKYSKTDVFGGDLLPGEPRSRMIELAKEKAGFSGDVYVVGDSIHDMIAAKETNSIGIGIDLFKSTKEELIENGSDYTFSNWKELHRFFIEL
ncbi:MAG: HAD family hydrolase [Candidatus Altiarchaeota archaeon]|nr:HAD family hydrolase [Candidatus Altiarchaeota archaeon]